MSARSENNHKLEKAMAAEVHKHVGALVPRMPDRTTATASAESSAESYSATAGIHLGFAVLVARCFVAGSGKVSISNARLQIVNAADIALDARQLDRMAVLRNDQWVTFRSLLETEAGNN